MAHPTNAKLARPLSMEKDGLHEEGSTEYATALPDERFSKNGKDVDSSSHKNDEKYVEHVVTPGQHPDGSPEDVLWVDWDGPDDPENPKK